MKWVFFSSHHSQANINQNVAFLRKSHQIERMIRPNPRHPLMPNETYSIPLYVIVKLKFKNKGALWCSHPILIFKQDNQKL